MFLFLSSKFPIIDGKAGEAMKFALIGISHKEAGEDIRSHVAFMDSQKITCYEQLFDADIVQAVIVSTCNRSEWYLLYEEDVQLEKALSIYEDMAGIQIQSLVSIKQGKEALIYLYEVCCGYHSLIIGEDQIEGQLQQAYAFAQHMHACQKQMHRIFQNCFKTVKRIKTNYQISSHPVSLPYIAMSYIKQQMELSKRCIFIIGSGEMAKLFLTYCVAEDVSRIYLCNRNREKAQALKKDERIIIVPFESRYDYLGQCDVVLCATSSPHEILCYEDYPLRTKPQYCIDLAMPADVDRRIKDKGVTLVGMEELSKVKDDQLKRRKELLKQAHEELIQGVEETIQWLQSQKLHQAISSLQKKSEESAQAAFEMIHAKIDLDHHEQKIVQHILRASFYRMVKEPMRALSKARDHQEEILDLVNKLYELEET